MNKLSKLTALLLALVLALGVPMQVMAEGEEIETKTKYYEVADQILQAMIMNYQTYGEYRDMAILIEENDFVEFFEGLSEADQLAMVQYVNDRFWESCYSYTNVAKPMPAVTVESTPATFSLVSRADTDSTDDPFANNGLEVDKNAVPNGDDTYTITMDSYVTGSVSTQTETTPLDVVMVLDVSGSMKWELDSEKTASSTESRLYELKTAVNGFLDSMSEGYNAETMDHRVDIIAYSGDGTTIREHVTWTDTTATNVTTLKSTVNSLTHDGATYTDEAMALAETQLTPKTTENPNGGYTYTGKNINRKKVVILFTDGVPGYSTSRNELDRIANTINTAYDIKNDLGATIYTVCIFSGAKPETAVVTYPQDNNDDIDLINGMMHAVSSNYPTAKATHPVTAEVTYEKQIWNQCTHEHSYRQVLYGWEEYCPEGCQRLGYGPNAWGFYTTQTVTETLDDQLQITYNALNPNASPHTGGASYYLSAGEKGELSTIFNNISNSIQQGLVNTQLGVSTVVKDVMTPYFDLPANASAVNVYTVDCVGFTDAGEPIWATTDGAEERVKYDAAIIKFGTTDNTGTTTNIVTGTPAEGNNTVWVEGFDYSGNYVVNLDHDDPLDKKDPEGDDNPFYGRKLVVEFVVEPTDGFLGGNNVVTNEKTSGIYKPSVDESGNPTGGYDSVEPFPEPDVDVDVPDLEIIGADQHIYLSNLADLDALLYSFQVQYWIKEGDSKYGIYTVDTILNHYTTLTFTLKDEQGNAVATYTIQAGKQTGTWTYNTKDYPSLQLPFEKDTTFYVSYEAISSNDSSNKSVGTLKATIYVYKPEVTFKDTQHDYLADLTAEQVTDYFDDENYVVTERKWYNESLRQYSTALQYMNGPEPDLIFTYAPVSATENNVIITPNEDGSGVISAVQCVPVNVKNVVAKSTYKDYSMDENNGPVETIVATNELDVSKVVKSYRQEISCDCAYDTPENKITDVLSDTVYEFVVHIKNAFSELKIIKKGLSVGESAIFTVTGYVPNGTAGGKEQTWTVVLTATENKKEPSVTITGLLVGSTATVEEAGNWSWRYQKNQYDPATKVEILPKTQSTATITITNKKDNDQWLDDEVAVHNNFDENDTGTVID